MIEQRIFEYFVNSLWQLPLLVLATWLVIRISRPSLIGQHILWLGTLALGVMIPLRGIDVLQRVSMKAAASSAQVEADTPQQAPAPSAPVQMTRPTLGQTLGSMATMRTHPIYLQSRTMDWLIGLYGLSVAFSLARLIHGWLAARRLVTNAMEQPLTALESSLLRACANRIGLAEASLPGVRFLVDSAASPMVVGVRRPVLLLPVSLHHGSDVGFDDHALTAVMLHELAHIRRRDYLTNLLARVAVLPIAYHPATQAVYGRIRQTREMICDAAAAGALASKSSYARSLLALAEGMISPSSHVEAVGLFDPTRNSLEERIMKLSEQKLPLNLTLRTFRIGAGASILVAGIGGATTLHVKATTPVVYAMQTSQTTPAAPAPPPAPQPPPPAPALRPTPRPTPNPVPDVHAVLQQSRQLTKEERKEIDQQMTETQEQIRKVTQDLQVNTPTIIPPMDLKNFPGPEFDKQMAEFKDRMSSPDFRKQMDEVREKINNPEFKKQIAEIASNANRAVLESPEFKRQMEDINARINSPEFRAQLETSKKLAVQARSDAVQHSVEARKQLAEASVAISEARKQVHDEAVQRQLDEAQRRIDQASKAF